MKKELVLYSRTTGCPFITIAKRVLRDYALPYREVFIDKDELYKKRVLDWTGFLSVPTIIVAHEGEDLPFEPFEPLESGRSPRGIDRGSMITEPNLEEFAQWLLKHGFISEIVTD